MRLMPLVIKNNEESFKIRSYYVIDSNFDPRSETPHTETKISASH